MVLTEPMRIATLVVTLALFAACPAPPEQRTTPVAAVVTSPVARVLTLEPGARTAIFAGPLYVSSVNPGGDMELALVPGDTCGGDEVWFTYSGGGVAVPTGQTLCARSTATAARTQAFSGR
jgi:hypothetical protein